MCRVLVLCPHTDDEIACVGSIYQHLESGDKVQLLAFSTGNHSTGANMSELVDSMLTLGITDYYLLDFEPREYQRDRQEILQVLCDESRPDIVYCPTTYDCHQDHKTITQEAIRAFRDSTIYGYEIIHNYVLGNTPNYFVKIDRYTLELKKRVAQCYTSQANKDYMSGEFLESLARIRGHQIGVRYAEAYQVIRKVKK